MSFTDFCEKMLIALYQDGRNSDEFLSFADLQQKYGIEGDQSWLSRSMTHLRAQRRIEGREISGAPETVVGRISGSGMAYIEAQYGDKEGVGTILEPVQNERADLADALSEITGSRMFVSTDGELPGDPREGDIVFQLSESDSEATVDSGAWTGLPKRGVLGRDAVERVSLALDDATKLIEGSAASNSEKAQARAYVLAIRALAEAPEPPADLIWELVHRANSIAGIASLFVTLVALFAHG